MPRIRSQRTPETRKGVILLVVISLLVLFFVVGLAFVIYSSAQATNARVWREGETVDYPDMDPEMLLSYFMGQLIYGTTNPQSALAANPTNYSLAPNMYGTAGNTVPYAGGPGGGVPYTYPDRQNAFLGAIKAGNLDFYDPATGQLQTFNGTDGAVLIPSYARIDPANPGQLLRVGRPASLPAPADPLDGDVKNLAWSPGFFVPGSKAAPRFLNNDSHWMDLGFAVTTAPDGRRYKPLFAPLILDLDNKLNVNVHGNILWHTNAGLPGGSDPRQGRHTSHQGFGPWEVNPEKILTARDNWTAEQAGGHYEARRIFIGNKDGGWNRSILGRYRSKWGNDGGIWGEGGHQIGERWTMRGPYYLPTDFDGTFPRPAGLTRYPGYAGGNVPGPAVPSFSAFPHYSGDYDGGKQNDSGRNHPMNFNFFNPGIPMMGYGRGDGRLYNVRDMEAVLRHGDTNSPALRCELFRSCPLSLADAKARRMVTTHAFDWDRPGVTPAPQRDPNDLYQIVAGGAPYPVGTSVGSEPYLASGARVNLGRVNLNRNLPQGAMGNRAQKYGLGGWGAYPDLQWYIFPDPITSKPVKLTTGRIDAFSLAGQFIQAQRARQSGAQEMFDYARHVTGAPDPNAAAVWTTLTQEQKDALRWLAQLAVNIVDYIDIDDNITPFRWKKPDAASPQGQWVFGTELPRLVVNEVFADIVNDPADTMTAANDYRVRFWVELNNPHYDTAFPRPDTGIGESGPYGPGLQQYSMPLTEGSRARLRVPESTSLVSNAYGWGVYRLTICEGNTIQLDPNKFTGAPLNSSVKTEVLSWNDRNVRTDAPEKTWDENAAGTATPRPSAYTAADPKPMLADMGKKYRPWEDEINFVRPMDKFPRGANEDNYGYYVAGPMDDFPGTDPSRPKATLRVKEDFTTTVTDGTTRGLSYKYQNTKDPATIPTHTVLLRRLCNPNMPPNNEPIDPSDLTKTRPNPTYNPYVTVDYMEEVRVNDRVSFLSTGARPMPPPTVTEPEKCYSVGRSQPFAAHSSQQVEQKPAPPITVPPTPPPALKNQPQHTMFDLNVQKIDMATGVEARDANGRLAGFAYHWLCHADRSLISPVELLEVSCYKPHELTQQFAQGPNLPNTNEPTNLYKHRAPWFDPQARIYRLMEVLSTTPALQMQPVGGRVIGRVNINTIFDREMFHALCDAQPNNLFTPADVDKAYDKMMASRSPMLTPSMGNDRPFRGLTFDPAGGIDDTLLRIDPFDARAAGMPPTPSKDLRRLFEPEVMNPAIGSNRRHPYAQYELMRKLFNNVTTRSNVFAVFLTVGFFEVNAAGQPIAEVRKNEGRHVRHRMFSIVDRSNLALAVNPATQAPIVPLQVGTRPVTIPTASPVPDPVTPGTLELVQVELPTPIWSFSGTYEGQAWSIAWNDWLLVDSGASQEVVRVTQVLHNVWRHDRRAQYFEARFSKGHAARVSIINLTRSASLPGNPGPQQRFDLRNPAHAGVLRYWSISE